MINKVTIKVSIADSGSGIPTDIERSGGEISAENRPNGGAVFRFSLPLVKELVA